MPIMRFYAYRLGLAGETFAQHRSPTGLDLAIDITEEIMRQQTVFIVEASVGPNAFSYSHIGTHSGYQQATTKATWRAPCTAEEQHTLLEMLAHVILPFQTDGGMIGADGITTSLQLARYNVNWGFSWWAQPPAAYQPLTTIVEQIDQIGLRTFEATRNNADLVTSQFERAKQWFRSEKS